MHGHREGGQVGPAERANLLHHLAHAGQLLLVGALEGVQRRAGVVALLHPRQDAGGDPGARRLQAQGKRLRRAAEPQLGARQPGDLLAHPGEVDALGEAEVHLADQGGVQTGAAGELRDRQQLVQGLEAGEGGRPFLVQAVGQVEGAPVVQHRQRLGRQEPRKRLPELGEGGAEALHHIPDRAARLDVGEQPQAGALQGVGDLQIPLVLDAGGDLPIRLPQPPVQGLRVRDPQGHVPHAGHLGRRPARLPHELDVGGGPH